MTTLVLRAKYLIDGSGRPPIEDAVVVVEGSTITGVFQGVVPEGRYPAAAQVIDLPDGTLLPGLIDCHVHLNLPGDGTPFVTSVQESDGTLVAIAAHNARTAMLGGITTLRDCGGRGTTTFDLRRALQLGYGTGARLVLCGQPITITGGHCWYFGGEADGVDGVRRKAREMAKLGADFIKVMGSGGGTPGTITWLPSFSREEIAALVEEAHRLNRRISIHCLCPEAIDYAASAGADQIEHATFCIDERGTQRFDPRIVETLVSSGAIVTGTLSVGLFATQAMQARENRSAEEQAFLDSWQVMLEETVAGFSRLYGAGVSYVAGTDAGWRFTPFTALPDELELMRQGGMPALETITAATGRAAQALGIADRVGQIQEGLEADIIAVDGNPLDDLLSLRHPELVMQGGALHVGTELVRPDLVAAPA